ncbi:MAG: aminotransferase class V-fold PLP-dependent enzyme [Acidobacteria bacterium]|nr:aminotransferase class V-fold PLP-dependent enzyme [Acidobacteriota bacterium]
MTNPQTQKSAPRVAPVPEIRSHFPALGRVHNGEPVAYFDGPGGTQVPRAVGDRLADYLYHHNANTHWEYPTSAETDAALDSARRTFADFFNSSHEEIAFGANMTTLTLHLSRALGRRFSPGDEIVVTELDHHANVDPWRELARDLDLRVRTVPLVTETGQLDWDAYARLLNERTRLVAVGAASNALGTINDVKAAAGLAHECGALVFVDAVHYVPHALADVRAWGCDFLACSAYKFNGPHVGVLYGKFDLIQSLEFHRLKPAPDYAPENAESGTLNHDFKTLWDGLSEVEGVRLYGAPPGLPRTPTAAFTFDGVASSEVARRLARRGVFVSHGDFYAQTVVERLGLGEEGLVRAGCAVYTTEEEIARLVEGVRSIREG